MWVCTWKWDASEIYERNNKNRRELQVNVHELCVLELSADWQKMTDKKWAEKKRMKKKRKTNSTDCSHADGAQNNLSMPIIIHKQTINEKRKGNEINIFKIIITSNT